MNVLVIPKVILDKIQHALDNELGVYYRINSQTLDNEGHIISVDVNEIYTSKEKNTGRHIVNADKLLLLASRLSQEKQDKINNRWGVNGLDGFIQNQMVDVSTVDFEEQPV